MSLNCKWDGVRITVTDVLWGRPTLAKQPKATMIGMQCSHFLGTLEKFIAKHKSRTREIEH